MATRLDVVAIALVDPDGRVLMAQRPKGKPLAGLWEFPGGKIMPEENPETALVREVREELGIETVESCLAPLGFYSGSLQERSGLEDVHLLMLLYVCRKWHGIPMGREGQCLKWVKSTDIMNIRMPQADRPLASQLRELLSPAL